VIDFIYYFSYIYNMNPNNQSQVQPQTPGRKLNFILPIKNAATIIIAILVVVL